MTSKEIRRIVVTFEEKFPTEMVEGMLESDFMGLGKTYAGNDRRVLFLYPFPNVSYAVVKETLDELRAGGELTYVEDYR
jgi:hypothetical protein